MDRDLEHIARDYDSEKDFDFHLIRFNFRRIQPLLRGGRVLELGCASGVMTRLLAGAAKELHVVDGAASYLDRLRAEPALRGVAFHHAMFEDFETELEFTDVVMARILEHLADPVAVLRKVREWLAPGGRLHVVVPNANSLHRRVGVAMGILGSTTELSERDHRFGHHRVYTRDLLEWQLIEGGFDIEHSTGVFLKPLSNAQMETFEPALVEAFDILGDQLPDWCAELYVVAGRAGS